MKFFPLFLFLAAAAVAAETTVPPGFNPKPVPRMQAVPLPDYQVSLQRAGEEIARLHFDPALRRPFVFPLIGPSGHPLTRMGHPHEPESHSHHNSVWISHHDVNGISFWDDHGKGRIVHRRVERLDDGMEDAAAITENDWLDGQGNVLLRERRQTAVHFLPGREWWLIIDLRLEAAEKPVTFGKTPFGIIGVRMAKSLGVLDGGGMIRNSEGGVNERGVFWKPSRWVDYSGAVSDGDIEGVTLMDHPNNPNYPAVFHVRDDGWMGASLTFNGPRTVQPGQPLVLRYGLYIHAGAPGQESLDKQWADFAKLKVPALEPSKK